MRLFVGFKGKNNTSRILVEELSPVHLLLTNSFTGLRKDIYSISKKYDHRFKDIFAEIFEREYKNVFSAAGIEYFYTL